MTLIVHTIDPDYDTVVVLKNVSTSFAPWHSEKGVSEPEPIIEPDFSRMIFQTRGIQAEFSDGLSGDASEVGTQGEEMVATTPQAIPCLGPEEEDIHFYVSSRHLQVASPWFRRALAKECWVEGQPVNERYRLLAHDWDEQALLLILNIFHLRNKQVPRSVSLETLAKVAVLVDYYECGEALDLFTSMWIDDLKKTDLPSMYCRDLILWIWIAWIFNLEPQFQSATAVAITKATEAIQILELPIPEIISDEVDSRRCESIELIIDSLHNLLDQYRSSGYACDTRSNSFQCGSFLLGALTKCLDSWSLYSPRPETPYPYLSFSGICDQIRETREFKWYESRYGDIHPCQLNEIVVGIVKKQASGMIGLSLPILRMATYRGR